MASQVGFVVGKLSECPHPLLSRWTIAIGAYPRGKEGRGEEELKEMWEQLLDISRVLPDLRAFLCTHLLTPSEAPTHPPKTPPHPADGKPEGKRMVEPFSSHCLVALQGAREVFSSFAGLVIIDASLLYPQVGGDTAPPLRLTLTTPLTSATHPP